MQTIGASLGANRGSAPGADTLRAALAIGVILYHSFGITRTPIPGIESSNAKVIGTVVLVPMFIALSGFLLGASAERTTPWQFGVNRFLRIFPALIVLTLLTAFVLGPVVTSAELTDYFSDPLFFRYLGGALAWPSYRLPGVFNGGTVNASLWSIPVELQCYTVLVAMMLTGLLRNRVFVLALFFAVIFVSGIPFVMEGKAGLHYNISRFLGQFSYFITGFIIYTFRERIPRNAGLFWLCLGISGILFLTGHHRVVLPIALTYCTVFIATAHIARLPGLTNGDYSYGIYLYGWPIQQVVLTAMPIPYAWWLNAAITLPITFAIATISWHLVEAPALRQKGRLARFTPAIFKNGLTAQWRRISPAS